MYTRTGDPVPPSDKATIDLHPPRYGSVVGFKRLPSGLEPFYAGLCEVVVIGSRSIGMLYTGALHGESTFPFLNVHTCTCNINMLIIMSEVYFVVLK